MRQRLTLTPLEDRVTPAAAGSLDPTFGEGGVLSFADTPALANFTIDQDASGTDSRFVALLTGDSSRDFTSGFARYTDAGLLDGSFGNEGLATDIGVPVVPGAVEVDGSGRILVTSGDGKTFQVSRLTSDGKLDTSFGTGGTVVVKRANDLTSDGQVIDIAVQPDGKIVLAGTSGAVMEVVRLNVDGSQDGSFADNGVRLVTPPNNSGTAIGQKISLMPDGRIVVAGLEVTGSFGKLGEKTSVGLVARILPNGQLDGGFGNAGISFFSTGLSAQVLAATAMSDGTVYVGQSSFSEFTSKGAVSITRLLPSGQPDTAYPADAAFRNLTGDKSNDVAIQADGAALLLRTPFFGPGPATLQRLTPDGRLDTSFTTTTPVDGYSFADQSGPLAGSVLLFNSSSIKRILLAATAFPTPAGTVTVGGTPNGGVTPFLPDAAGALQPVAPVIAYPNFPGTARTATADVNGDGVADYVTGPGPGGGPNVVVTDGKTGAAIADLDAFETTFTGGVFVAAADLNGDGFAEVVVTPDQGGGPVVAIYDGARLAAGQDEAAQLTRFFGIDDDAFRGGARPAFADLDGDGTPDLVVAAGFGGGPRVALFDGRAVMAAVAPGSFPPKLAPDFFVFEETLRNGVFVGGGDLTGDGLAELVVGGGPGGGPRVLALDGRSLLGGTQTPVANFFAGDPAGRGGVHVAVVPDADGSPALVTGSGEGQPAEVRVYTPARGYAAADQTLAPFGGATLAEGVFVG